MPNLPRYEEVEEWNEPHLSYMKNVFGNYDIVYIRPVKGPFTDA
jgi:hypothetical protein